MISITREEKLCAGEAEYTKSTEEAESGAKALDAARDELAAGRLEFERSQTEMEASELTHKVTARNLFRNKKRMLMTIFGVCGSVTLIFAGFSVQHSISGAKDRQFGDIMKYDLIVAEAAGMSEGQHDEDEIDLMLASDDIARHMPIRYETLTTIAGRNGDRQEMTMIVPERTDGLADYVTLCDGSADNAKAEASSFMEPGGVKGVVQNTTMINQIDTIVGALNRIM